MTMAMKLFKSFFKKASLIFCIVLIYINFMAPKEIANAYFTGFAKGMHSLIPVMLMLALLPVIYARFND